MLGTIEMCCGQRPFEQRSHGRRVRFCIRCGATSDAGAATLCERMRDEQRELLRGDKITPALALRHTVEIRGFRK